MAATHRDVIAVAIAGGSCSGKSRLARSLRRRLHPDAAILALDDFYRDLSSISPPLRSQVNFDDPLALDWELFHESFMALQRKEGTRVPIYDYATHTRGPRTRHVAPRPILLIEGLWPWWRKEMSGLYALKIFYDTPAEMRLARRLRRDVQERDRTRASIERQWSEHSEPMFERHVLPQRRNADFIVGVNLPLNELQRLATRIRRVAGFEAP